MGELDLRIPPINLDKETIDRNSTERRSGCQTIAQNGQLVGGSCNLAARSPRRQPVSTVAKPLPPVL